MSQDLKVSLSSVRILTEDGGGRSLWKHEADQIIDIVNNQMSTPEIAEFLKEIINSYKTVNSNEDYKRLYVSFSQKAGELFEKLYSKKTKP